MLGVHRHQHRLAESLRQHAIELAPACRDHMMRFIENDPVRTTGSCPHRMKTRKQMPEIAGTIAERYSEQVETQIHRGILENRQRLIHRYGIMWSSQREHFR